MNIKLVDQDCLNYYVMKPKDVTLQNEILIKSIEDNLDKKKFILINSDA